MGTLCLFHSPVPCLKFQKKRLHERRPDNPVYFDPNQLPGHLKLLNVPSSQEFRRLAHRYQQFESMGFFGVNFLFYLDFGKRDIHFDCISFQT